MQTAINHNLIVSLSKKAADLKKQLALSKQELREAKKLARQNIIDTINERLKNWQGKLELRKEGNDFCLKLKPWANAKSTSRSIFTLMHLDSEKWCYEKYIQCSPEAANFEIFSSSLDDLLPPGGEDDILLFVETGIMFSITKTVRPDIHQLVCDAKRTIDGLLIKDKESRKIIDIKNFQYGCRINNDLEMSEDGSLCELSIRNQLKEIMNKEPVDNKLESILLQILECNQPKTQ